MGEKSLRAVIIGILLLTVTPALCFGSEPVLQPESSATPNCQEKCLNACQMHCRLGCVYDCKCPEEAGPERDACQTDCVKPCSDKCQGSECTAGTCDQQCAVTS